VKYQPQSTNVTVTIAEQDVVALQVLLFRAVIVIHRTCSQTPYRGSDAGTNQGTPRICTPLYWS